MPRKRKNRKGELISATKKSKKKKTVKKLRKLTPTLKQRIAFKKLVEISRNPKGRKGITIGSILRQGGYAPNTAIKPSQVTKSKGWQYLMKKYFPDDKVAKVEEGQLNASRIGHYIFPIKEDNKEIKKIVESFPNCKLIKIRKQLNWKRAYFSSPDNTAIGKSLDRIYKMKKRYPKEDQDKPVEIKIAIINYGSKNLPTVQI